MTATAESMQGETWVIAGAGQAAAHAAMQMRKSGFTGRLLIVGDEAHAPYERPPLSKSAITDAEPALPLLNAVETYAAQAIELMTGTAVTGIDLASRQVHTARGTPVSWDKLLLATGGRARRLHLPGAAHCQVLRSWDDTLALRARLRGCAHVTVIGAGVIGLELASSARQLGCAVTVLEAGSAPMARLVPPVIGEFIEGVHRAAGVDLRFGVGVGAIEALADGSFHVLGPGLSLQTGLVVAGIGMVPNSELAADAGIAVEGGAVCVDEHGATSAEGVFACGDVAAPWHTPSAARLRIETWQHATRHAQSVARNMCGDVNAYAQTPWSWTDQFHLNIQMLGQPASGDETVLRGDPASGKFVALHLAAGRVVGATLVNQGRLMRACKALMERGPGLPPLDATRLRDPSVPVESSFQAPALSGQTR